jgi:hypothetical protein
VPSRARKSTLVSAAVKPFVSEGIGTKGNISSCIDEISTFESANLSSPRRVALNCPNHVSEARPEAVRKAVPASSPVEWVQPSRQGPQENFVQAEHSVVFTAENPKHFCCRFHVISVHYSLGQGGAVAPAAPSMVFLESKRANREQSQRLTGQTAVLSPEDRVPRQIMRQLNLLNSLPGRPAENLRMT